MKEPKKDVRRHLQTALLMLLDAALACLSLVLALQIYYDMNPPELIAQLPQKDQKIFRLIYGGKLAQKICRLYEYRTA